MLRRSKVKRWKGSEVRRLGYDMNSNGIVKKSWELRRKGIATLSDAMARRRTVWAML